MGHSQITALRKETRSRHETMIRPSCCSALLVICCLLVTVETKSIGAVEIKSLAPAGADSTGALEDIPDSDPHIDEFRESGNKHAEMTKMKSMEVGVKQAHRQHQVQLKKVKALRKDPKRRRTCSRHATSKRPRLGWWSFKIGGCSSRSKRVLKLCRRKLP